MNIGIQNINTSKPLYPLNEQLPQFLAPYLPKLNPQRPFITLTYAQSLDSRISAAPGERTVISHLETKTMTHYLRANHDAILIGSGTVLADDPGLNCRLPGETSPIPVVIDPDFKWSYKGSKMEQLVAAGEAREPWIVISDRCGELEKIDYLQRHFGKVIRMKLHNGRIDWDELFTVLKSMQIDSVMIEGGAHVVNDLLLRPTLVDSLIITIGPVYLGSKGVDVSPSSNVQLRNVTWWSGIQDSIMCANLQDSTIP
jgi:2,5-diamino-6-(ribosylamino)-4(3H)-pyrimidinone 5'-phosphate reductase